jgi:hypothetical protein
VWWIYDRQPAIDEITRALPYLQASVAADHIYLFRRQCPPMLSKTGEVVMSTAAAEEIPPAPRTSTPDPNSQKLIVCQPPGPASQTTN